LSDDVNFSNKPTDSTSSRWRNIFVTSRIQACRRAMQSASEMSRSFSVRIIITFLIDLWLMIYSLVDLRRLSVLWAYMTFF